MMPSGLFSVLHPQMTHMYVQVGEEDGEESLDLKA